MKNNWTFALFPLWLFAAFAVLFISAPGPAYAANCGGVNKRPCTIFERIPSCNKGLVEYLNGKCLRPICGALNQKACDIGERIPSCDSGLRESLGKCIVLKPGEIPIFATIGEWSSELARVAEGECIKALSGFKGAPAAIGGIARMEPEQSRYFKIGFTCAALTQFDQLSGATAMIQEMNRQMQIEPCSSWIAPLRPVCAFYHTSVVSFGAVAQCAMSLAVENAVGGTGGGGSVKQIWLGLGKLAWSVKQMTGGREEGQRQG